MHCSGSVYHQRCFRFVVMHRFVVQFTSAGIWICYQSLDLDSIFHWFHQNSCLNSAMVLRFILDIPTFSRFFIDIPTIFALYLRCHNIFALYPRYLDISRQMWMQNLMQSKDEISEIPKLTKAY